MDKHSFLRNIFLLHDCVVCCAHILLGKIKNKRKYFGSFLVFSEKKRKKQAGTSWKRKMAFAQNHFGFSSIRSNEIGLLLSSLSRNACNQFFETFKNGNLIFLSHWFGIRIWQKLNQKYYTHRTVVEHQQNRSKLKCCCLWDFSCVCVCVFRKFICTQSKFNIYLVSLVAK